MTEARPSELESRVLILGPGAKDAQLTRSVLEEVGIPCVVCGSADVLLKELDRGAGAVIVADDALFLGGYEPLKEILDRQLPWSDLPVIVVIPSGAGSSNAAAAVADLGNVALLERPVRVSTLIGAVRTALRARTRQYQLRAHMQERELTAEALKEADRRKNEFLAILAHELRNPLAPIRNALTVMRLAGPQVVASEMGDMLERQVDHLVRLVDDLFEVSRITRGSIELRTERLDLAGVIRHAAATSRPLLDAAGQVLEVEIDPEPLWVTGDPIRLAQVFANLLNNASKFSDENGVVWFAARRRADTVEVSVRDFGAGISPEMLPRVFDMFTQGSRCAPRNPGGLGIGLTLAKSLVDSHGGRLEARSDGPNRGSEFLVHFPYAGQASQVPQEAPASRGVPKGSLEARRILIVDDNQDSADSVAMLLKLMGADVHVTYDGPSALAAIDSYHPEVALMDLGLPGMDGYEIARRIRSRSDLDNLMLIAITGWGQLEDRLRSRSAGFQHHLVKPVDPGALQSLLTTLDAEP